MLFQHVSLPAGVSILVSHPVILLCVGCLMAHVIIKKNDLHLVISDYLMAKAQPSSEFALVLMMMGIAGFLSM